MVNMLYWGNGSQGPITDSVHTIGSVAWHIGHGIGSFFHGIGKLVCSTKYDDINGIVSSGKTASKKGFVDAYR
jgi:hypothetical protein